MTARSGNLRPFAALAAGLLVLATLEGQEHQDDTTVVVVRRALMPSDIQDRNVVRAARAPHHPGLLLPVGGRETEKARLEIGGY